jgi:hypothetical protein
VRGDGWSEDEDEVVNNASIAVARHIVGRHVAVAFKRKEEGEEMEEAAWHKRCQQEEGALCASTCKPTSPVGMNELPSKHLQSKMLLHTINVHKLVSATKSVYHNCDVQAVWVALVFAAAEIHIS